MCNTLLVVLIRTELYAVQLQFPSTEPDFVYKSFRLSFWQFILFVYRSLKNVRTNKCNLYIYIYIYIYIPELELMWLFITDVTILFLIVNNEADSGALGLTKCRIADGRNLLFSMYCVCLQFEFDLHRERKTEHCVWRTALRSVSVSVCMW
jgi:hypothetical protein